MKISGRIKALIVMAVVIYVLAHVVRAMLMTLARSSTLLTHPPRMPRLGNDTEIDSDETIKRCSRC